MQENNGTAYNVTNNCVEHGCVWKAGLKELEWAEDWRLWRVQFL